MKEKLRIMIRTLAQHHYSTDTILRAILLSANANETEVVMDRIIELTNQTKTERELIDKIEEIEEKENIKE